MEIKKYVQNVSMFTIGPIVAAFIGFINVPLITRFISPEEYGKTGMFLLAQGVISMLVYLGLDQAYVREYNSYKNNKSHLMTNTIIIPVAFSLLLSLIAILFSKTISIWLFDTNQETVAVTMLAVMIPFMVIYNFNMLSVRMQEKGLSYSFLVILIKVISLILTIILFFIYERSFRSVVYAIAIAEIICGIVSILALRRDLSFSPGTFDSELIVRMLKYGIPLIPAVILVWIMSSADKIMLRTMYTYAELGLYEAAFKIVNVLGIIQSCFTIVWTPIAFRWYEEKVSNKRYKLVSDSVCFAMTLFCFLILIMKDIVGIILGADFVSAMHIFPFLLLHPIMYTISETTVLGISFKRKTSYNILITAVSGGFNIIANYLLIPIMGGRGAAIATGLSYIIFFWMRTMISRKMWWDYPLGGYIICTVFVLINCAVHTFMTTGLVPYLVSAVSIILLIVLYYPLLKRLNELRTKGES